METTRASTVLGVCIEIFVADLLTVVGLAGQKYALMKSRRERTLTHQFESENSYQHLNDDVDISFYSGGFHAHGSTNNRDTVLASGEDENEDENDFCNISENDNQSVGGSSSSRGIEIQTLGEHSCRENSSSSCCLNTKNVGGLKTLSQHRRKTITGCFSMNNRGYLIWLAAFGVFVLGQASEAIALSLASQTDVVSVSNLTLFWNALISVYLFHEKFNILPVYRECSHRIFKRWDLFSYGLLMTGSLLAVVFTPLPPDDKDFTADMFMDMWTQQPYSIYAIMLCCLLVVLTGVVFSNWGNEKTGNLNGVLVACITAILSAFTITLSKVSMTLLRRSVSGENQFSHLSSYVMVGVWIVLLVSSLFLLNLGLASFEQGLIIPIYEVFGTLMQLVSGILYYQTYTRFSITDWCGFLIGVFLMCWGIWLTSHREFHTEEEIDDEAFVNDNSIDDLTMTCTSGSTSQDGLLRDYIPSLLGNENGTSHLRQRELADYESDNEMTSETVDSSPDSI